MGHSASTALKSLNDLGKEVESTFLSLSSSWPTLLSGAFKVEGNAIEVDDDSRLLGVLIVTNITQWDLKKKTKKKQMPDCNDFVC